MTRIQSSQSEANISDADLDRSFMRLQRLLEKKVRLYWHKSNFEKYSDNQIVPWGLRIQIFPNVKKINDSLKQSWEINLQTCSLQMISILCEQYESELTQLNLQINGWYQDHVLSVSSTRFSQRETALWAHQEKYTLGIIHRKTGKFLHDKPAHDNGFAYKWNQTILSLINLF